MFLQVSVCPQGRVCVVAGGCHAWLLGGMRVCGGGHVWLQGGMHRIRRDTVNERAVRILLECILVSKIPLVHWGNLFITLVFTISILLQIQFISL